MRSEHITPRSPSPQCCRPPTSFPTPLICLLSNPVPFVHKAFLYGGKSKFQRVQEGGKGKSNEEEGQGRGQAEVKAHRRGELCWEGVLSCLRSLRG